MAYKCGNCGIEFANKAELVEHMIEVHNSPFIEGDYAELSDKMLVKKNRAELIAKVSKARGEQ